jgi:hypothetical protein
MKNIFKSDFVKFIVLIITCITLFTISILGFNGIVSEKFVNISVIIMVIILLNFLVYGIKEFIYFKEEEKEE